MTRKDFELIAEVISTYITNPNVTPGQAVDLIDRMATALATTNANFNHAAFRNACDPR